MSNELKVLCVRKEHVTAGLGGQLTHGAHPLDKELFISSIEPHLEVKPLNEIGTDTAYMQIMPFLMLPRAHVQQDPPSASTSLVTYAIKESSGRTMLHAGFASWVEEGHVNVYAATPAPQGVETIADPREGKIALFQSLQNSVQSCVRDNLVIKPREFEGEPEPENVVVQDAGYALVDHSTQQTQCFLGILFMCLLPKQYTAGQNYLTNEKVSENLGITYEDRGELSLVDLCKPEAQQELDSLSRIVVNNLMQAEIDFNAAQLSSAEQAAEAIEKASDSSQQG